MGASVLTGLLLGLAFPLQIGRFVMPNFGWLAWFALVPLFLKLRTASPRTAFMRTFVAALVWYSISIYWVYTAMNTYGHLSPLVSAAVLVLMIVILAAYIGIVPLITRWIATRLEHEPPWLLPAVWVAVELVRNYGPCGGFPWSNVAQTQYAYTPLIQTADVAGIYGLMFVIVWTNRWLARVWARLSAGEWRAGESLSWVTLIIWLALLGYGVVGFVSVGRDLKTWPQYTVALLQGNVPQEDKWREGMEEEQIGIYRRMMGTLEDGRIDLVIWPEASFPWAIAGTQRAIDMKTIASRRDAQQNPWPILLGALGTEGSGPTRKLYNSIFALEGDGKIAGRYDKTHLVPFGEYVPYQQFFFFARRIAAPIGNYQFGREITPLHIGRTIVGPLVCYEDIFPEVARAHARRGAEFFANLTNDAWYGWSAAAIQHASLSAFRAVENRRYIVRATNTGVSAVIDPLGRFVIKSPIFEPAVIVGRIGLAKGTTLYTKFGNIFVYICAAAALVAVIKAMRSR